VPALQPYKWYWRIEPNIEFSCAITYDPFREMAKHNKKYGYTVALWELDNTVPTLFRAVSDFKKMKKIKSSALWKSMIRPSWLPFPFRKMNGGKGLHDTTGDSWNLCHFWSNFEIASLEFFRSKEYRELFEYLDQKGGFYSERVSIFTTPQSADDANSDQWGDASVHSLAAALMLPPEQLHHFADFGYSHYPWRVSPANAKGVQLPGSNVLGKVPGELGEEKESGIGCRCEWKETRNFQSWCFNRIQRPTHPEPWPNKIGW
jgi:mannosyltransferase